MASQKFHRLYHKSLRRRECSSHGIVLEIQIRKPSFSSLPYSDPPTTSSSSSSSMALSSLTRTSIAWLSIGRTSSWLHSVRRLSIKHWWNTARQIIWHTRLKSINYLCTKAQLPRNIIARYNARYRKTNISKRS